MKKICGIRRKRSEIFCRTSKKTKEKKSMARTRRNSEQENSSRSYDEILAFITSEDAPEDEEK